MGAWFLKAKSIHARIDLLLFIKGCSPADFAAISKTRRIGRLGIVKGIGQKVRNFTFMYTTEGMNERVTFFIMS